MDRIRKIIRKFGFIKFILLLTVLTSAVILFIVGTVLIGIFSKTPEPYILVLSAILPLIIVPVVISGSFLVYLGFDRTEEKFMKLSNLDSLTKIYNRYYILETLQNEMKRVDRYSGKLSIAVFDITGFRKINEKYGFSTGDELLQQVIKRMHKVLRSSDTMGRNSGDEFIIVLPAISEKEAVSLGKRVADIISADDFECGGNTISVGVTIGAVEYSVGEKIESFIMRAEKNMSKSKSSLKPSKTRKK